MNKALPYIVTFICSAGLSLLLTPVAEQLAIRFKAMDTPDPRKVHSTPTPRWGGIAIASAVILAVFLVIVSFENVQIYIDTRIHKNLLGLLAGSLLMVILGMLDDRYNLPAKLKLLGQITIAILLIKFGIAITFVNMPLVGFMYLPTWVSWVLTLFWIVGLTNAVNLIDGLDGLLAGVSTIFAILFFIVSFITGQFIVALVLIAIAGACLGFLRYNFNPARIFMGDSGSLFLGLVFASLSIIGALKITTTAAFIIPIMIMGLPIFDTSFAIVRRFSNGKPIFSPDKEHVHHQLLARGYSVRQAVILIYIVTCTLGAIGISIALLLR